MSKYYGVFGNGNSDAERWQEFNQYSISDQWTKNVSKTIKIVYVDDDNDDDVRLLIWVVNTNTFFQFFNYHYLLFLSLH